MFWWFERGGRYLRCEAAPAATGGFELRLVQPDGTEHVERFSDSSTLLERQVEVMDEMIRDGWDGPHGWNV